MTFNLKYFIIFILLFLTEVVIAKYTTGFIRHTVGDYLVVILLYAFLKSFIKSSVVIIAGFVLLIAYLIEFIQLTNLKNLYLEDYKRVFQLVLGTSFSVGDLVAYTLGILTVLIIESKISNTKQHV